MLGSPRIFCKHGWAAPGLMGYRRGSSGKVFNHPERLGFAESLLKQAAIADNFRRRVVAQLPVSIAARDRGWLPATRAKLHLQAFSLVDHPFGQIGPMKGCQPWARKFRQAHFDAGRLMMTGGGAGVWPILKPTKPANALTIAAVAATRSAMLRGCSQMSCLRRRLRSATSSSCLNCFSSSSVIPI